MFKEGELNKPETESEKRVLNPEEIEILRGDMDDYVHGLEERIREIKEGLKQNPNDDLILELSELEEEYGGLKAMMDDINSGNFEEITEKPV